MGTWAIWSLAKNFRWATWATWAPDYATAHWTELPGKDLVLQEPGRFYQANSISQKAKNSCIDHIPKDYKKSEKSQFYDLAMTCCLISKKYEHISALKETLGHHFETLGEKLNQHIDNFKRERNLCHDIKGMDKNDIINAGIRHCRTPTCHSYILRNINQVDISTALDWVHGISMSTYNNITEYMESATSTLFELFKKENNEFVYTSNHRYTDFIASRSSKNTKNSDKIALDISNSFGTLMNRLQDSDYKIPIAWEDFIMENLDRVPARHEQASTSVYQKHTALLNAIGASGSAKFQNILLRFMNLEEHSINIYDNRYFAVEATRNIPCYQIEPSVIDKFFTILEDEDEDSEIRITCYSRLMDCPTSFRIERIVGLLKNRIKSLQVGSFLVSDLRSMSKRSEYAAFVSFLKDVIELDEDEPKASSTSIPFDSIKNFHQASNLGYSKAYYFEIPFLDMNVKIEMIWSEVSSFLRSFYITVNKNLKIDEKELGANTKNSPIGKYLKLHVRCRNFKELISNIVQDTKIEKYLKNLPSGLYEFINMDFAYDQQARTECEEKGQDCLTAEVNINWMGRDIIFLQGTTVEIKQYMLDFLATTEDLSSDNWFTKQVFNFLNNLQHGIKIHRTINFVPCESVAATNSFSGLYILQNRKKVMNLDYSAQAIWSFFSSSKLTLKPDGDFISTETMVLNDKQLLSYTTQVKGRVNENICLKKLTAGIRKIDSIENYFSFARPLMSTQN